MLHFMFGVMATYLGYIVFNSLNMQKKSIFLSVMFSFCFSITFGVIWEFIEFGYDKYLGSDMQKDVLLDRFNTAYFSSVDDIRNLSNINRTEIHTDSGVIVIPNGYLDVGLSDTMKDLIIDAIGSTFASCILYFYIKKDFNVKSNL